MAVRWALICDASRARLFGGRPPSFELLRQLEHADSRARARDLMADTNGRKGAGPSVGGSHGGRSINLGVGRGGVAPDTDPKEVEGEKFARELADLLEQGLRQRAYEAIFLAAPPHFLGLLRATLSAAVLKRVDRAIDKDLTKLHARDIEERIRHLLATVG